MLFLILAVAFMVLFWLIIRPPAPRFDKLIYFLLWLGVGAVLAYYFAVQVLHYDTRATEGQDISPKSPEDTWLREKATPQIGGKSGPENRRCPHFLHQQCFLGCGAVSCSDPVSVTVP